jgi:trans-AT polyketide synthase, acyltransferase and oxidoreductase domains
MTIQAQPTYFDIETMRDILSDLTQTVYAVRVGGRLGLTHSDEFSDPDAVPIGFALPLDPRDLGDPVFKRFHGTEYAYMGGAMANGIASEEMVIALGQQGILSAFGAAGLVPNRILEAIQRIQAALPNHPYAFNLIHSPNEEAIERRAVELYLEHGVQTVEASAFLGLTPHVVRYRVAGLSRNADGSIRIANKIIAKVSRREVAEQFMRPPSERLLNELLNHGWITPEQAQLAQQVPMADDITVEADSGGHTDNRPLVNLLPAIVALRDQIQREYEYDMPLRVGAAGGIGTPEAVLAAFMMGAAYVVTGSVNQACLEAGTSAHSKKLLAQADMADVIMAPAADMFEMGVQVQLLKRGTMFPMRAQKLYDLYRQYESLDAIPARERQALEKQIFQQSIDDIWAATEAYFNDRDPRQVELANQEPKRKMALVFRWYLGLSSRWSNIGEQGRELDYQIWCGPAMGAFNAWTAGTYLATPENRRVADVATQLMRGAAYLYRVRALAMQGVELPSELTVVRPTQ